MTTRGAYWQGVRLWEVFQTIDPWATRTTDVLHLGVERQYAARNADSPNFTRPVRVRTVVEANKEGTVDIPAWVAIRIQLADVEKDLVAVAIDTPQGDLSITYDTARKADVTGGPYAGAGQVIAYSNLGGGWVPTAGRKVLVRNPATGAGFVADIDAVVAGTSITIDVPTGYSVTSVFDIVDVQLIYPDCAYRSMDGGSPEDWEEIGIPSVVYEFDCESDPEWSSDYDMSHDNT